MQPSMTEPEEAAIYTYRLKDLQKRRQQNQSFKEYSTPLQQKKRTHQSSTKHIKQEGDDISFEDSDVADELDYLYDPAYLLTLKRPMSP